jgi:hypothetical protein
MMRPISCLKRDPPSTVADFIDHTSAMWKNDRLQEFFLPLDIEVIQTIPISTMRFDDFWASKGINDAPP